MDPTQEKYKAPAVDKAIDVLEVLAAKGGGMTIKDMADTLNKSISEIFRVIIVMERRGLLHKNPSTDVYTVTHKLLEIGFRSTPAQNLVDIAVPIMFQLAQVTGQSCHLVVPSVGHCLVVAQQAGTGPTGFGVRLGALLDAQESASGNVILAFSAEGRRDVILDGAPLKADLVSRLEAIASIGFEQRESRRSLGVRDISFPIFGFDTHVVAALTIPYLTLIDGTEQLNETETRGLLLKAATQISAALGDSRERAAEPKGVDDMAGSRPVSRRKRSA